MHVLGFCFQNCFFLIIGSSSCYHISIAYDVSQIIMTDKSSPLNCKLQSLLVFWRHGYVLVVQECWHQLINYKRSLFSCQRTIGYSAISHVFFLLFLWPIPLTFHVYIIFAWTQRIPSVYFMHVLNFLWCHVTYYLSLSGSIFYVTILLCGVLSCTSFFILLAFKAFFVISIVYVIF